MTTPSATMTETERMKLIKWAKKNGAASIKVGGVEIDFVTLAPEYNVSPGWNRDLPIEPIKQSEKDLNDELIKKYGKPGQKPFYEPDDDSTKKAMAALRSHMDDPDVFAHKSDEWANQTRLPRL